MIRLMRPGDLAAVMRLKQAAGWNQTEQDWANVLALEPEGCWVWDQDGRVVGTTTAVCYGRELAWIGMVLVLPEYRGRGIARRLMEHSLEWLEGRGIAQVKLDATDMGRPLYEKLGFRDERSIERWGSSGAKPSGLVQGVPDLELTAPAKRQPDGRPSGRVQGVPGLSLAALAALDREAFGVDRTALLTRLLESSPTAGACVPGHGFVLGRPGSNAYFVGPGAAGSPEVARELIHTLLDHTSAPAFFWDLFPDQPAAVDLARELGFERQRSLIRMALRPEPRLSGRPERVFAAAGFEYG